MQRRGRVLGSGGAGDKTRAAFPPGRLADAGRQPELQRPVGGPAVKASGRWRQGVAACSGTPADVLHPAAANPTPIPS